MVSTVAVDNRGPARKATTAPARTAWIDMARGLAEVSVVTFHILQAMDNAGLTPQGLFNFWTPVGDMIRMPLMMFVAGLFVEHSLRKGPKTYFTGKIQRVVWPYLVWAHFYAVYWWLRPSAFDSNTFQDVLLTTVFPKSHLWFLQSLFIYYAVIYFLLKRGIWVALAVSFLVSVTTPLTDHEGLQRLAYLFLFFTLGIAFNRVLRQRGFPFGPLVGAVLIALAVALPVLINAQFGYSKYMPIAIPASIVGVLACLAICRGLVYVPVVNKLLSLFGTFSLEIYCAHIVFSSMMRQILIGIFGWQSFWPIFLLATTAGLFMPIVMALALRRFGLDLAFEWPKRLFRREPATEPQNF